jgi:hypothetical protein
MWKFFTKDAAEKQQLAAPPTVINPMAKIQANAVQSMSTGTVQALSLPVVVYDTDGMTSVSSKITIQHAGKYLLEAYMAWVASTAGNQRQVWFQVNGAALVIGKQSAPFNATGAGQQPRAVTSTVVALNVGDTVEAVSFQDSGAALNSAYNAGADVPELSVTKIDGAIVNYVGIPGNLVGQLLDRATNSTGTTVTATTVAAADVVCTGHPITLDGVTQIEISFSTYALLKGTSYIHIGVYDGATQIGEIIHSLVTVANPGFGRMIVTPSAGVHTYSIRAYVDGGSGNVFAQAGGSGLAVPNEMLVRRIA